ncbi:MAG: hypothetical protein WC796_01170 [Candidatus Pacearchaeota archaeon]|jgi:hypothetical protein
MLPKVHVIIGLLFSIVVYFLFPSIGILGLLIIFLSSFLIDVDHYIYFVLKKHNLSLIKAYRWFRKHEKLKELLSKDPSIKQKIKNYHFGFFFLHGIEAILVLLVLFYFTKSLIFIEVVLGFIIHQILDFIELYKFDKQYGVSRYYKMSFLYTWITQKNKKPVEELL